MCVWIVVFIQELARNVAGSQEKFNVDLRFPRANGDPDISVISGTEDDVYDCKEHLLIIEEDCVSYILLCMKSLNRGMRSCRVCMGNCRVMCPKNV